jgi:hypothetical protein
VQGPATYLAGYFEHVVAVGFERASGRGVHVTEECVHHAAGEERYARRGPRGGGGNGGNGAVGGSGEGPRRVAPPRRSSRRAKRPRPRSAQHPHPEPHSPTSGKRGRDARGAEPAREREQGSPQTLVPKYPQHQRRQPRKTAGSEELLSRGLEPAPIAHARGANRLAPAAAEASVQMLRQGCVLSRKLAPLQGSHEDNAAARTVRFVTSGEICGAGRKTETAVDARVERGEVGCRCHPNRRLLPRRR